VFEEENSDAVICSPRVKQQISDQVQNASQLIKEINDLTPSALLGGS